MGHFPACDVWLREGNLRWTKAGSWSWRFAEVLGEMVQEIAERCGVVLHIFLVVDQPREVQSTCTVRIWMCWLHGIQLLEE